MSSQGVLLVSSQKIKAFTNVNENLDEQLLLPNIQIAQDIGLQTLLGTQFYDHILLAAQGGTLTPAETTLLEDYISPYILWGAVYEALPDIYMRMMNKSTVITVISTAIAAVTSWFVGVRKTRKELESMSLNNIEKSIEIYSVIIDNLKDEVKEMMVKIDELEDKIDKLTKENAELHQLLLKEKARK